MTKTLEPNFKKQNPQKKKKDEGKGKKALSSGQRPLKITTYDIPGNHQVSKMLHVSHARLSNACVRSVVLKAANLVCRHRPLCLFIPYQLSLRFTLSTLFATPSIETRMVRFPHHQPCYYFCFFLCSSLSARLSNSRTWLPMHSTRTSPLSKANAADCFHKYSHAPC